MSARRAPPEVLDLWERPLAPEEFESRLALARAELDGPEWENIIGLIQWFQRRYPTALDRLRYDRKARPLTGGR